MFGFAKSVGDHPKDYPPNFAAYRTAQICLGLLRELRRGAPKISIAVGEDAPFLAIADGDDTALVDAPRSTVSASILVGALRALTNVVTAC